MTFNSAVTVIEEFYGSQYPSHDLLPYQNINDSPASLRLIC